MSKTQNFITWASINNWVPLIAMAVGLALTFGTTLTRIALLEQKLDISIKQQTEMLAILKGYQQENQQLSLKVNTLETIIGIKK